MLPIRVQDADESAYYEYICKRAGINVAYCAEQFENDGSPVSTIVKGVKRAMAGEYSRELSVKVFAGQCRLIELGFRQGGAPAFLLVCGEGRLNAFRLLGETHIPALVVNVTDEDAFIMSLAENIARRGHRPLEILADIELLLARDYTIDDIITRTGLSAKYVRDIVFLLEKGEERLAALCPTRKGSPSWAVSCARLRWMNCPNCGTC